MEDWNTNQMTPFDMRISTHSLQLIKLLIPYLPPHSQRIFAIYIKFLELQYTFSSFHTFRQTSHSTQDIFQELRPYMPPSASESMDYIMNIMSMMEILREMNETSNSDSNFDPMSMMQTMLSPEQQSMFEMYNSMFTAENETQTSEGGENTA